MCGAKSAEGLVDQVKNHLLYIFFKKRTDPETDPISNSPWMKIRSAFIRSRFTCFVIPVVDVIKLFWRKSRFPKIKILNKARSDYWTCTKMLQQCHLKLNLIRTLLICSKMAYSCCFSLGENLDFLQNSVITLTTDLSAFGAGVTVRENHRTLTVEGKITGLQFN